MRVRRSSTLIVAGAVALASLVSGVTVGLAAGTGPLVQPSGAAHCFVYTTSTETCTKSLELQSPFGVTTSPDGKSVYVANYTGDAITTFSRASNGTLTRQGCISETGSSGTCATGHLIDGPAHLVVSPDGKNLYATSNNFGSDNGVLVFDRSTVTGALTEHSPHSCISQSGTEGCVDGRALVSALDLAISPDGKSVYVTAGTSGDVDVFDRDSSGGLTQKAAGAGCFGNATDTCTAVAGMASAYGVVVSPDGTGVYVASNQNDDIVTYTRNTSDGTLTSGTCYGTSVGCGSIPGLDGVQALAFSPDGTHLYAGSYSTLGDTGAGVINSFSRETLVGPHLNELTSLTGKDSCLSEDGSTGGTANVCRDGTATSGMFALAVSADGKYLYSAAQNGAANGGSFDSFAIGSDGSISQSGCLTHDTVTGCTTSATIQSADGIATSPDSNSAYGTSQIGGITEFTIGAGSTATKPAKPSFAHSPTKLTVSKKGAFTYPFGATKALHGGIAVTKGKTALAKLTFVVPASGIEKAKLKLSKHQLKALKKVKHEKAKVTVALTNSAGTTTGTAKLTLKAPKR